MWGMDSERDVATHPGPISRHVADMDRILVGPRGAKTDILDEVRDGLDDAAEGFREAGCSALEAERAAVAEFGEVTRVAPELQRELAVTRARHALMFFVFAGPVGELVSRFLWSNADPVAQPPPSAAFELAKIVDLAAWLPSILAAVALLVMGFCERAWPLRSGFVRCVGYGVLVKAAWVVVTGVSLSLLFGNQAIMMPSPGPESLAVVFTWSLWVYALWLAFGCLRAARAGERQSVSVN